MDYRQFRQWSPPTISGHRALPDLSKASSIGTAADPHAERSKGAQAALPGIGDIRPSSAPKPGGSSIGTAFEPSGKKGPPPVPGPRINKIIGEPVDTPKPSPFAAPVRETPKFEMESAKIHKPASQGEQATLPGVEAFEQKRQQAETAKQQGSGSQLALPGTGVEHGPEDPKAFPKPPPPKPETPPSGDKGGGEGGGDATKKLKTQASADKGKVKKPVSQKAGPNVLGWYHFGQSMGMAAGQRTGGATTARQITGRGVATAHQLLNRRTPMAVESAREGRESQLQRQQGLRMMGGEGGGVVTQSSTLNRALPVIGGIRRLLNDS